ncbi:MAG TPA: cytochrome P450 [Candidatus Acidoferrales bacterium]|nr:cytochrome P450 [Candidatus Acidoferrales bacterium]
MSTAAIKISAPLPLPPGPRDWLYLGPTFRFARDWMGYSERCVRTYGDVVFFRFLNIPVCLLGHPDGIEYVLVKNQANFLKSRDYRAFHPLLGKGLLTSEGEFWQTQRKRVQPAFRHENIAGYAQIMLDAAATAMGGWQDGETRDIHADMMSLTLEVVAKSLFGSDVSGAAAGVGKALGPLMELFIYQAHLAFLLPESVRVPQTPGARRAKHHIDDVVWGIIRERRASPQAGNDLLQTLLEAQDEHGKRMTDEQLRDEVMTLFIAGHETTSNALAWTWYLLSQNPAVEENLYAELRSVLGGRAPGLADLPRLPYTEMVVKESMRIYPPAWGFGRRPIREFELNGYRIPAGTNIFISQWVTQRDPRFFPDPERFDPERWRDDPIRTGRIPRFAYFPFGGGPRVCVGAGFAMMEATLLLAAIAQRFRFSLVPGHPVETLASATLRPKHGIKMTVHKRP